MTLNLKFDLDPPFFRENECHHQTPRGRFNLKKVCLLLLLIVPFFATFASTNIYQGRFIKKMKHNKKKKYLLSEGWKEGQTVRDLSL